MIGSHDDAPVTDTATALSSHTHVKDAGSGNLTRKFFSKHGPLAMSPQYINMREIVGRYKLPPGDYCIVPTTYEANEEADFVIRVFTEKRGGNLM